MRSLGRSYATCHNSNMFKGHMRQHGNVRRRRRVVKQRLQHLMYACHLAALPTCSVPDRHPGLPGNSIASLVFIASPSETLLTNMLETRIATKPGLQVEQLVLRYDSADNSSYDTKSQNQGRTPVSDIVQMVAQVAVSHGRP